MSADIYQIGNALFRDLRAFLDAANIDSSKCKVEITVPTIADRKTLVARLRQDALPASPMSAARLGNNGGKWQGVDYEIGVAK